MWWRPACLHSAVGIAVGAAISNNSCCGWSYSYWNCNWHGGTVVYSSNVYYGNNAWHGGYYGSSATAYGPYGSARVGPGYNPSTGTYARGGTVSTPYGTRSAGQAYNPSTGTYARGASASKAYGSEAVGQAYNPNTGAYGATHQASNAYGNYGSSVVSKNGQTAYTQHQTTAQGSVGTVQTSKGAKGIAASGANGNAAAADKLQTATNMRRQTAMSTRTPGAVGSKPREPEIDLELLGNQFRCREGLWGQAKSQRFIGLYGGGGSGWQSREASARGSASRGGGGGWGGRRVSSLTVLATDS